MKRIFSITVIMLMKLYSIYAAELSLIPSSCCLSVTDSVEIKINIKNVNNLFSFATDINFDPLILQIYAVKEDTFLNQQNSVSTTFLNQIDNINGKVILGLSRLDNTIPGVSSSVDATILTLHAKTVSYGTSNVNLSNTGLLEPDGITQIPFSITDTSVTVQDPASVFTNSISNRFDFNVFPNPANNQIRIFTHSVSEFFEINIYNILGQNVFYERIYSKSFNWNLNNNSGTDLPSGIYFLLATSADHNYQLYKKIIIQK